MANKGSPFSIRLSAPTDRYVEAEAKRTKRSKSTIVEMLTEEAARMRRFPGIAFQGNDADRRAWVIGTGLDVWEIIDAFDSFPSVEVMAAETDLSETQIRLALAYRDQYPDEIEEKVAGNRRPIEELRELYPFISVEYVD